MYDFKKKARLHPAIEIGFFFWWEGDHLKYILTTYFVWPHTSYGDSLLFFLFCQTTIQPNP